MFYLYSFALMGTAGKKHFVLPNRQITKKFYNAQSFDMRTGQFPILDENGEIIEYMDLMGNFTKTNTLFAKKLYNYVASERNIPFITKAHGDYYYCGLLDFPSKYLIDDNVKHFIKMEERRRYLKLCNNHNFSSIFQRLMYKRYTNKVWKQKERKAEYLKTHKDVYEIFNDETFN